MRPNRPCTCLAWGILLALSIPGLAQAGAFAFESGCEQLTVDPPTYRLHFIFADTHLQPFCEATLEPIAADGEPAPTILSYTAPSTLAASTDSLGRVVFRAARCYGYGEIWSFLDSLTLIVDRAPAHFTAALHWEGYEILVHSLDYTCEGALPTRRRTWGSLKQLYRSPLAP